MKISSSQLRRGQLQGYLSGLESAVGSQLNSAKIVWEYEPERIPYVPKNRTYTPDFVLTTRSGGKIYIETKGRFLASDRSKHLLLKQQYPDLDLRFVFNNPNQKLYKGAKTTYGEWCEKHGFSFSKTSIPPEWIKECMHRD